MDVINVALNPNISFATQAILASITPPYATRNDGYGVQYSLDEALSYMSDEDKRQKYAKMFSRINPNTLAVDVALLSELFDSNKARFIELPVNAFQYMDIVSSNLLLNAERIYLADRTTINAVLLECEDCLKSAALHQINIDNGFDIEHKNRRYWVDVYVSDDHQNMVALSELIDPPYNVTVFPYKADEIDFDNEVARLVVPHSLIKQLTKG